MLENVRIQPVSILHHMKELKYTQQIKLHSAVNKMSNCNMLKQVRTVLPDIINIYTGHSHFFNLNLTNAISCTIQPETHGSVH